MLSLSDLAMSRVRSRLTPEPKPKDSQRHSVARHAAEERHV